MRNRRLFVVLMLALVMMLGAFVPLLVDRTDWLIAKRLTVQGGGSDFQSNIVVSVPTPLATTTPAVVIQNRGLGNSLEIRNASGTPVYQVDNAGNPSQSGAFESNVDLNGAYDLILDADADSYLHASADDTVALVMPANGVASVLTGSMKIGDGSPSVAQNGEDMYVEGQLEVDGEAQFDGTVDINGATAIDGGLTDIGGGSYATANGDNDLGVAGDLEVDGSTDLDGTLAVAGASTMAADVTVSGDATGGNAGARNQLIGMPAVRMVTLGTMTNGSTESANYLDDSPTGEWSEVDGGTNIVVTADSAVYRVGTTSLQIEFTDVVTDEGVVGTAGAQDNLSGNESIGFWIYADAAITAGDFNLVVDDSDGTDQAYDIGAVSAGVWTWKEIDISACDANCDTMDNIKILATAQGAANLTAINVYVDGMWKWDADDEEALGVNLVQDGVLSVLVATTTTTTTLTALTEQTNFVVNYQSGNDVIVTVGDQSANSGMALVAYQ